MQKFESELGHLSELYSQLRKELGGPVEGRGPEGPAVAVDTVLRNHDLFARIDQMNDRLARLVDEWKENRDRVDGATRKRVQELAGEVLKQALDLVRIERARLEEVESLRTRLGTELNVVTRGSRFLESVKPLKSNYPKFIDSQG